MAVREEGIVVSNDQFRDLISDSTEYAKCIEERLLPYVFMECFTMAILAQVPFWLSSRGSVARCFWFKRAQV